MKPITFCYSVYNNLPYLELSIKSVLKGNKLIEKIIVFAENCTDGTDEWLQNNLPVDCIFIEHNDKDNIRGIGGGINYIISKVETPYFYLAHADMVFPENFDKALFNYFDHPLYENKRLIISSYRCEPNIWGNPSQQPGLITVPTITFGEYHHNFNYNRFNQWALQFSNHNEGKFIESAGGAGGFIMRKEDWDYIGGNDDLFKPSCYEDIDLFLRMRLEGFSFIMTLDTMLYHFGGRGGFWENDQVGKKQERQIKAEQDGYHKWITKWGEIFQFDNNRLPIITDNISKTYFNTIKHTII